MSVDVPDQLRKTVIADGNESWLDELPGLIDSLAQEWSLMISPSLAGGHVALVIEVTLVDGTAAVLKIGVPGGDVRQEAAALRLQPATTCCATRRCGCGVRSAPTLAFPPERSWLSSTPIGCRDSGRRRGDRARGIDPAAGHRPEH